MSVQDCIFCKIVAGKVPSAKIYENDCVLAFLDVGPVSEGHVLVVLKQHTCSVDQTDPLEMAEIAKVLPELAEAIKDAMAADGYNVLCNNGRAAGQVVGHLHFHIIPRNTGDRLFSRWPSFEYEDGKIEEIAGTIREKL